MKNKKTEIDPRLLVEALEHLGQGVSYFDHDLNLVFCNGHYLRLLDFPVALGKPGTPAEDFFRYNAERGEYGEGDIDEMVRTRVELARRFEPHVIERERPNGPVLRIEGVPVESGGFVTTYQDVTELRQYQNALEEANQRLDERAKERTRELAEREQDLWHKTATLESIVRNIEQGISLFDQNYELVLANQQYCNFLGLPTRLITPGTKLIDIMREIASNGELGDGDVEALAQQRFDLAIQDNKAHIQRQRPNGTIVDIGTYPVPEGLIFAYTDVTEQKNTEELLRANKLELENRVEKRTAELQSQLQETKKAQAELRLALEAAEQASEAKSDFLAQMSHELRTPLNSIIGFSDTMRAGVFGNLVNSKYEEYIDSIHFSGVHLLSLINDILEMARLEAGKLSIYEEDVDFHQKAEAAMRQMDELAKSKGIAVTNTIPVGTAKVKGDSRRILQMLLNLLSNAIKFTDQGGAVWISYKDLGHDGLAISVLDNGHGMSSKDVALSLEAFTQVGGSALNAQEGTGLGLSIVKGLIEAHDGTIDIQSEANKGTEVRLIFPRKRRLDD